MKTYICELYVLTPYEFLVARIPKYRVRIRARTEAGNRAGIRAWNRAEIRIGNRTRTSSQDSIQGSNEDS